MIYIVSVLVIMQIISFYLIFKKINPIIIKQKVKGIVLKPIPKVAKIEDGDGANELIRDIMKTIVLEDWNVDIKYTYDDRYEIFIRSNSNITIKCAIRLYSNVPYLSIFRIIYAESGDINRYSVSISGESGIANEVISFMWDFIVKYHEDNNETMISSFNRNISGIGSKLKAVNRDKKLKDLGI